MTTKDYQTKRPLRIFLSYFKPHKKLFLVDMLCALTVAAIDLAFPLVSRTAMNEWLPNGAYATFFLIMSIVVLAYVLRSGLNYIICYWGHTFGIRVEADIRRDLFTHMQELGFDFYDENRTGQLMSRLTSDLFDVTELAHHGPEDTIISCVTIIGAMIVMFAVEWRLALVIAVTLPLCLWFTLSQRKRMKDANVEVKKKTAEISAAIESSISGIRTAKAFANEQQESDKFDKANELFRGSKVEYYKTMGLFL